MDIADHLFADHPDKFIRLFGLIEDIIIQEFKVLDLIGMCNVGPWSRTILHDVISDFDVGLIEIGNGQFLANGPFDFLFQDTLRFL